MQSLIATLKKSFSPKEMDTADPLQFWRERILEAILAGGLVIGMIAYIPALVLVFKERFWSLGIFDTLILTATAFLFFRKDLRYALRASFALFLSYALGAWLIFFVGFLSGGPVMLFTFAILASLLMGVRAALIALFINALTLYGGGIWLPVLNPSGSYALFPTTGRMITAGATFLFANTLVSVAVAVLLKGLQSISHREKTVLDRLSVEHEHLKAVRDALAAEIALKEEAEKALKASETRFREMAELLPSVLFETDPAGRLTFVNRVAFKQFMYTPEDFETGLNALDMIAPEHRIRAGKDMEEVLKGREAGVAEYELLRKDGSRFPGAIQSARFLVDGIPAGLRGVVLDLTEIKSLESQLFQAQKMEAIGTLAGGIAHDFNNLLTGIQGRAALMALDLDTRHPLQEHLRGIETHVKTAADLTRQLLGFARGGKYEVLPRDLNEILEKSADMFGRTRKEIRIHRRLQDGIWPVEADRSQMEQVLLNLFLNAWQAMEGNGDLFLETQNVELDPGASDSLGVPPGRFVKVKVTDTGSGMDAQTLKRIFDPFFSTKEKGRGTGLGLASAYGIVKNHGGIITAESRPGRGATFTFFLPATDKAVEKHVEQEAAPLKGSESILLVDDEEMVLEVGAAMLKHLGYRVIQARGARQALNTYRVRAAEIQLVILDVIMPEMTGEAVYAELRRINAEVRVLVSSGYSVDEQARGLLEHGCRGFIQKPFGIAELSLKVREVLEDRLAVSLASGPAEAP